MINTHLTTKQTGLAHIKKWLATISSTENTSNCTGKIDSKPTMRNHPGNMVLICHTWCTDDFEDMLTSTV